MFSFRLNNKAEYNDPLDTTVAYHRFYVGPEDGINFIFFEPTSTKPERDSVKSIITSHTNFQKEFLIAQKLSDLGLTFLEEQFMPTDLEINVQFSDQKITSAQVHSFASKHGAEVVFEPASSLSNKVFILRVHPNIGSKYYDADVSFQVASSMWEIDSSIIEKVVPSLRIFKPMDPNDNFYGDLWHIENNGVNTCYGTPWVSDADADFDRAWNFDGEFGADPYYSGAGIVVATIDFDGIQLSHPD